MGGMTCGKGRPFLSISVVALGHCLYLCSCTPLPLDCKPSKNVSDQVKLLHPSFYA